MTEPGFDEQATTFFRENPHQFGWVLVVVGVVLLLGTILRWGWIFEGGNARFNIAWIADTFGFRFAQVVMGLLSLVFIGGG